MWEIVHTIFVILFEFFDPQCQSMAAKKLRLDYVK